MVNRQPRAFARVAALKCLELERDNANTTRILIIVKTG